ncbi:hypothetical protein KCU87_g153, partial [Aureobasidium melanogenum]
MKGDSHCGCACGGNDARSLVFDNTSTFLSPVSPPYLSATAQDFLKEHLPLLTLTLIMCSDNQPPFEHATIIRNHDGSSRKVGAVSISANLSMSQILNTNAKFQCCLAERSTTNTLDIVLEDRV